MASYNHGFRDKLCFYVIWVKLGKMFLFRNLKPKLVIQKDLQCF